MANRKQRRAAARSKDSETVVPDEVLSPEDAPAVPFPEHEEDVLFKAQMQLQHFILGHWKKGLAVVGVVLFAVLIVGEYGAHQVDIQRDAQAKIADITRQMPEENPLVRFGLQDADASDATVAQVAEGARRYSAVAESAEGTGAAMAWAKSGAAWVRAGDIEKAKDAYGKAHALGVGGVVGWSVGSAYAQMQANAGDVDGAVTSLKAVAAQVGGLSSAQALYTAGLLLEDAGRSEESLQVFTELQTSHPDSNLTGLIAQAIDRVGAGG